MRLGKESPVKPRGPTILAIVAVLATFALAFAFLGTGTASASTLSSPGFVATSQLNPSLALPTSNTLADPTVNLVSRDPSGLVVVNQGPDVGYYGSQLHKDQVLGGSNVTTSAANTNNAAIGSTGSLAVLTSIGIGATGTAGMMLSERDGSVFAGNLGTSTPRELMTPKDLALTGSKVDSVVDQASQTKNGFNIVLPAGNVGLLGTTGTSIALVLVLGAFAAKMVAGARTATRER